MKYRDPNTGELKDIYVKAADTLPIGTIVDFDGDTVPDGWETVDDTGTYKKIKKIAKSIGVVGKILNSKSTSAENTYSCDYINKSTGFIGWTNPNPTSEFAAQTIALSTSDYDEYEVEYLLVSGATSTKSTGRISKNNTAYLDYIGGSGTLKGFYRMVIAINNNYINFNDAICSNDGSTANIRCIPQRVILYKNS